MTDTDTRKILISERQRDEFARVYDRLAEARRLLADREEQLNAAFRLADIDPAAVEGGQIAGDEPHFIVRTNGALRPD